MYSCIYSPHDREKKNRKECTLLFRRVAFVLCVKLLTAKTAVPKNILACELNPRKSCLYCSSTQYSSPLAKRRFSLYARTISKCSLMSHIRIEFQSAGVCVCVYFVELVEGRVAPALCKVQTGRS